MTSIDQICEKLAEEIVSIGLLPNALAPDDYNKDLLTSGFIDSFGFVQFLTYVEVEFSISIDDDLQFDQRIRTIKGMGEIIIEAKL